MNFNRLALSAILTVLLLSEVSARADISEKKHFLQGGLLTTFLGGPADTDQGTATKSIHRIYPSVGLRFEFGQSRLRWTPSVQFTPIPKNSQDDAIAIHLMKISLAPTYLLGGPFEFSFGPGILYQIMFGKGGTVDLQNGSSTSSFFRPATNSTMRLLFLEAGLGLHLYRVRLDLLLFTTGLMSSQLAWHAGAFLGWGIF